MSEQHAIAYAALRERVTAVVGAAPEATVEGPCPATPEWTVHDVLAHMVGVTSDVLAGRLDGIASDAWTAAQVDARRGVGAATMLGEWAANADGFDAAMRAAPDAAVGQALFDAATHELDIRHALGAPGGRDSEALAIGWEWLVSARTAAPALEVVTEDGARVVGAGDPVASVRASRFELFRATCGRRTRAEVEAYDWSPGARPDLLLASTDLFAYRDESLGE